MSEATGLRICPDGPNVVTGELAIVTPVRVREMKTAVLCRCGHSSDKPFCDGAHVKVGFADPACLPADAEMRTEGVGRVTITPQPNGPNKCECPLTIPDAGGRNSACNSAVLCRC